MDNKMDKQAILNFLQKFQSNIKLFQNCDREYSKFYTSYLRETPIGTTPTTISPFKQFKLSFLCFNEQIEDNLITEQFLSDTLSDMFAALSSYDEKNAVVEILNKESEIYSDINLINEPFTKESLEKAITKVLTMVHFNKSVIVKPKALLVSPHFMFAAKEMLADGFCQYFPQNLIVNQYIHIPFAAIITDAPNSFRHFVRKPIGLSVVEDDEGVTFTLTAESYFEVTDPMSICTISL
jgi:hypothetical protein